MQRQEIPIQRLRQTGRNIGAFWMVFTLLMLVAVTAYTFAATPALLGQGRGWLILALSLAFGLWFVLGQNWFTYGRPETYHRRLMRRELPKLPLRTLIFCAILFASALALSALDDNFRFMLYTIYGIVIGLFALPWGIIPLVPVVFVIFAEFQWLPQQPTAEQWLGFLINLLVFCLYTAIVYLPFFILSGRFEREEMFSALELSHRELAEAHGKLEAAAERERELAVLRERERLAREMHDTLGHALVLANVKLEAALRLRSVDPNRADHEITATQGVLRTAMGELRASLANLRGVDDCDKPLSEALILRAHEAAARAGWEVTSSFAPEANDLPEHARETLLRVGMEAIANAERHARARLVAISLVRDGDHTILRVTDDGCGFDSALLAPTPALVTVGGSSAPQSPPGHYGITGMAERVAATGGTLTIGPNGDGRGACVEARVPISA